MDEKSEILTLDDLLDSAEDLTGDKVSYATNVRIHVSNNEVTIDLFYAAPHMSRKSETPIVQRIHRIVMPLAVAKSTGKILLQGINAWEERTGITLPFDPQDVEGDSNDDTD